MSIAKNTIEGRAEPFMERIENLLDDLESKRGAYIAECRVVRGDIKEIYTEARDAGIPTKALKGLIKFRELERKQEALADGLESEEAQIYEQLRDALGELGAAAADRAGYPEGNGDQDEDVRPRHMQENERTLSAEEEDARARLGRGPEAAAAVKH